MWRMGHVFEMCIRIEPMIILYGTRVVFGMCVPVGTKTQLYKQNNTIRNLISQ